MRNGIIYLLSLSLIMLTVFLETHASTNPIETDVSYTGLGNSSRFRRQSRISRMTSIVSSTTKLPPSSTAVTLPTRGRKKKNQTKVLPSTASSIHPVSLLYEMKLNPLFMVKHCSALVKGIEVQSMKATLLLRSTKQTFGPAYGRSKKQARRRVAEQAAVALFNVTFDEPTPISDQYHDHHLESCKDVP